MKKLNKEDLISQAYGFVSYLFREPKIKIKRIFLFGSAARGDFDEKSDIDIFVDVDKKREKETEKKAKRALRRFYEIEGEKWRLKGIKNQISLKTGFLEEWELKNSIEREGIVLYGGAGGTKLKKYLLFVLEPITPIKKRMKITRKLFGRKEEGYQDKGLILKYEGKVLDPRSFMVSEEGLKEISFFLAKEKVRFHFEEIWR